MKRIVLIKNPPKGSELYEVTFSDGKKKWTGHLTEEGLKIAQLKEKIISAGAKEEDVEELCQLEWEKGGQDHNLNW